MSFVWGLASLGSLSFVQQRGTVSPGGILGFFFGHEWQDILFETAWNDWWRTRYEGISDVGVFFRTKLISAEYLRGHGVAAS